MDLLEYPDIIKGIIQVIQMIRNDPDEEYKSIFEEATELAQHTYWNNNKKATSHVQASKMKTII